MRSLWRSGDLFIWMTASGVAMALLMMGGLLFLIMLNGLGSFWPAALTELRLDDGQIVIGQALNEEIVPHSVSPALPNGRRRTRFRVGNRDVFPHDFRWVPDEAVAARATPADLAVLERREWGPLYGRIRALYRDDILLAKGPAAWEALGTSLARTTALNRRIRRTERDEIGRINSSLETLRLEQRARDLRTATHGGDRPTTSSLEESVARLQARYHQAVDRLDELVREAGRDAVSVVLSDGREVRIPLAQVIRALRPNEMGWLAKTGVYLGNLWEFVAGEPREANTEGGIFPAIFGTVMMVFMMTIAVMPFGVIAALYLREYARQGFLVQLVRIAVVNLAGIPSIVFGLFGVGFFVYLTGGTIDRLFFPEALPSPTFGTGGILWASLTLALLTVPVVIVATEEGLSAVPREFREGSIALGATKLETIWQVVLPCALPGILTGLILAMARAAGEVAPLMLTGVVKLAPALPVDGDFPFLHLDRKFMHLGFHIYDLGFQSPNVEAAKPMVYMTALVLIVVVITLNILAVMIRNRVRKRFAGSAV